MAKRYSFVSNARNQFINFPSRQVTDRGYWFMDWGFLERISCSNIFTAFLAISKEISAKIVTAKFDLQCSNTYSLTNIVIYYVYEKQQGMDFSMNNTVTLVKSAIWTDQARASNNCKNDKTVITCILRNTTFGSLLHLYFESHKRKKLEGTCLESQRMIPLKRSLTRQLTRQTQKLVTANYKKNRASAKFG